MAKFGGAAKVYASKETKMLYNFFVEDKKIADSLTDLFHLCAAIGIMQDKRTPIEVRDELINVYSIDKDDIFEILLEEKYPGESGEQRLQVLQEFAETGIRYIKNEFDMNRKIDSKQLMSFV